MLSESLKAFIEKVTTDASLREQLSQLRASSEGDQEKLQSGTVRIAAGAGFTITRDDLAAAMADTAKSEYVWKKCPDCDGAGYFWETCHTCNGIGEVTVTWPAEIKTCPTCNGAKQTKTKMCTKCSGWGWLWAWQ